MAELTDDLCCAPEQQATCCEPSEKADCCGDGCDCDARLPRSSSAHRDLRLIAAPTDDSV
jgi:hypothetical protein